MNPKTGGDLDRILCFDLGWTLEDETPAQLDRVMQIHGILASRGIQFDPDAFLQAQEDAGRLGVASVYAHALEGIGLNAELRGELKRQVKWNADRCCLYPDAAATLKVLAGRHVLKIIANQSKPVDERLDAYGIRDCFSQIVCSCQVGCDKPNARIFHQALEPGKTRPVEYWMIGDRVDNDIVPAKKLGWKTVRLLKGPHRGYVPRDGAEEPDHVISSLEELPGLLSFAPQAGSV